MNKNMTTLLDILLQQNDFITAKQLAEILGVTERSIRNYVRSLNGSQYREPLIISSNLGYKIQKGKYNESVRKYLFDKDENNILFQIALLLTSQDEFLSFDILAGKSHYSVESIRNQVQKLYIRIQESNYQLVIDSRIFVGIRVIGDESQKRLLLEELLNIDHIVKEDIAESIFDLLNACVTKQEVEDELEIVDKIFSENNISMDFTVYLKIICHMLILIYRNKNQKQIFSDNFENGVEEYPEYRLAKHLLDTNDIKSQYENEIVSLTNYLISLPINIPFEQTPAMNYRQKKIIDNALKKAEKYYSIAIYSNKQYRVQINRHIQRLLNPLKESIPIFNPYSKETKREYFFAYSIACFLYDDLKVALSIKIPESEVAYLAIRIQLILLEETKSTIKTLLIYSGKPSELALYQYKIQTYFTGIQINAIKSTFNYSDRKSYQLIIILDYAKDKIVANNVVYISHRLTTKDISTIQNFVDSMGTNSLINGLDYYHINEKEKKAVLQLLLEKSGYGELLPYVLKREVMSSTDIANKVALPHPFLKESETSAKVIIGINEHAIDWGSQTVQLIIIYIPTNDLRVNKRFFSEVYQQTKNIKFVNRLIKTKDKAEFIKYWNKKGDY